MGFTRLTPDLISYIGATLSHNDRRNAILAHRCFLPVEYSCIGAILRLGEPVSPIEKYWSCLLKYRPYLERLCIITNVDTFDDNVMGVLLRLILSYKRSSNNIFQVDIQMYHYSSEPDVISDLFAWCKTLIKEAAHNNLRISFKIFLRSTAAKELADLITAFVGRKFSHHIHVVVQDMPCRIFAKMEPLLALGSQLGEFVDSVTIVSQSYMDLSATHNEHKNASIPAATMVAALTSLKEFALQDNFNHRAMPSTYTDYHTYVIPLITCLHDNGMLGVHNNLTDKCSRYSQCKRLKSFCISNLNVQSCIRWRVFQMLHHSIQPGYHMVFTDDALMDPLLGCAIVTFLQLCPSLKVQLRVQSYWYMLEELCGSITLMHVWDKYDRERVSMDSRGPYKLEFRSRKELLQMLAITSPEHYSMFSFCLA